MSSLLRTPTIIFSSPGAGKKVERAGTYRTFRRPTPAEQADLAIIVRSITSGQDLDSRFYSARAGHLDTLLKSFGVLHLHLGGAGSDCLLFLQQYTDKVVFLEIDSHKRFANTGQAMATHHSLPKVAGPQVVVKRKPSIPPNT